MTDPFLHQHLGPWVTSKHCADGGVARIYLAHHCDDHKPAAIKILMPHASDERWIARQFQQEIDILKFFETIKSSACVGFTRFYRYGTIADRPAFVMEYVAGQNLSELLSSGASLPKLELAKAMIERVAFLHRHHIIHNDIKPDNFQIRQQDNVLYLLDPGNARRVPTGIRASIKRFFRRSEERIRGTPAYMAPELLDGVPPSFQSDVYAIGACLHHLFTGRPPRSREEATKLIGKGEAVGTEVFTKSNTTSFFRNSFAGIPVGVIDLMRRCLQGDLEKRPSDAGCIQDYFLRAMTQSTTEKKLRSDRSIQIPGK
jgi:serine/threonine protein kinase